jgi:hypothetical protein
MSHITDETHTSNIDQRETSLSKRIFPLDILKALSIVAVVSYHSIFVPRVSYRLSVFPLEIIFSPLRFCVPILFTISFILLKREIEKNSEWSSWKLLRTRLHRLATPTIFWFVLTFSLRLLNKGNVLDLVDRVLTGTIFQGSYFLVALLEMTPIFIFLDKKLLNVRLLVASFFAQIILFEFIQHNLIFNSSSEALKILRLIDRPFFIYWFIYMFLGAFIWKKWAKIVKFSHNISIGTKSVFCILGCAGIIFERYSLLKASSETIQPFDYAMISCILSIFVLFSCCASIQEDQLPDFLKALILIFSKYSLGIFCVNGVISEILLSIGSHLFKDYIFSLPEMLIIKLIGWPVLLFSCLGISIFLDRVGLNMMVR